MSYDVQLYPKAVKQKYDLDPSATFFDEERNLVPFSDEQLNYLKKRLLSYGYAIEHETADQSTYLCKKQEGVQALLTTSCLYFSAGASGVFEISMTASEFTDTGEFKKYDPQDGGWEDL